MEYKALFVSKETHSAVKSNAAARGLTIDQYIQLLFTFKEAE